jgi:hypothetical protein
MAASNQLIFGDGENNGAKYNNQPANNILAII